MQSELKNKSVKGVVWNLLENISSYIIRFIIGIILARLLTPADYGIIGMTVIFFSIADVLINSGFGQAFIQKKDADENDANTVFSTNFFLSLAIYAIFWFSAPYIAVFFNQEILTKLIRVMSIVVIINSLNIIQLAIIRKNLEFKKKTLITFISSIISGVIGIICAYKGLGVWSLVVQQITNRTIICLGLYLTSKWKLRFSFSYSSFLTMFSYGSWLLLTNITIKIFDNLYRFVIGKFFPASDLGLFDRGQQFPSMIHQQFTWSVGAVAFPVYSKLLDNNEELEKALLRFVKYSSMITLPLLAILYIVAEPFILLLLTEKWAGVIPFLKISCLIGMVAPLYEFLTQFIEAIGFTKKTFRYTLLLNILRILNVILNLRNGIEAILIGELVIKILALLYVSTVARKYMGFNFLKIIYKIKTLVFCLIPTILAGWGILLFCPDSLYVKLLLPSIIMLSVNFGLLFVFNKNLILSVVKFLKNRV